VGGRREVRLGAPYDVGDTELRTQEPLDMREVGLGAFLAVRDEADSLALERARARRGPHAGGLHLIGRIEHPDHGSTVARAERSATRGRARDVAPGFRQGSTAPDIERAHLIWVRSAKPLFKLLVWCRTTCI